jgi:hypothetical protein
MQALPAARNPIASSGAIHQKVGTYGEKALQATVGSRKIVVTTLQPK